MERDTSSNNIPTDYANFNSHAHVERDKEWNTEKKDITDFNSHAHVERDIERGYNVPLVKTQMKKIIVTAKTLYSHPKNVSKIYAALHTDLAW